MLCLFEKYSFSWLIAFIKKVLTKILGHKSSKTTEIYTHVSSKQIANIKTPFDELEIDI
jgi:integrase